MQLLASLPRPRKWSWRLVVLGLAFLPILFSAGACPKLADAADPSATPWFCLLVP